MAKSQLVQAFEARARRSRKEFFVELLRAVPIPLSILDVGGTVDYWRTVDFPLDAQVQIVLLNTFDQHVDSPFESVVGDARDLSRYRDREFDVVFSNSVICLVGSFTDQQCMAR